MSDQTIRIELSLGARSLRCLMAAAMVFAAVSELASENVTLTTYYPAPSGVYAQMITTGDTYLARDSAANGGKVGIGSSARPDYLLHVRGAVGGGANLAAVTDTTNGQTLAFGANASGVSVSNLNNNGLRLGTNNVDRLIIAANGNVGIGTADTSAAALTVNGGIRVGDTANCTQPGTLTWSSGKLRVCDGSQFLIVNTTLPPPAAPGVADASATGQVGMAFSFKIEASNSPNRYDASPLPSGLTVNTVNGYISGIPTATWGPRSVAISATNAGGTGTANLTLTISPAPIPKGTTDGSCGNYNIWGKNYTQPTYPAIDCWFWGVWGMGGGPGATCAHGWTPIGLDEHIIEQHQSVRGCPPQADGHECDVYSPMCRKD